MVVDSELCDQYKLVNKMCLFVNNSYWHHQRLLELLMILKTEHISTSKQVSVCLVSDFREQRVFLAVHSKTNVEKMTTMNKPIHKQLYNLTCNKHCPIKVVVLCIDVFCR